MKKIGRPVLAQCRPRVSLSDGVASAIVPSLLYAKLIGFAPSLWNCRRRMAALVVGLVLWCSLPSAAHAQYPCGNGPGPGEVVVGQTPGSQAHAPVLLCRHVGGEEGAAPEQEVRPVLAPMVPSYMAAAYHMDTSAVWMTNAHWSADSATRRAMSACAAAMGDGCILGATVYDVGHIAVVHDAMGLTWVKGARIDMKLPWNQQDNTIAPKQALRLCLESSFGCELADKRGGGVLRSNYDPGTDHSKDFFPAGLVKRHHWIMVAAPDKVAPAAWRNKSWLDSGKQDSAAARKALLSRCQQDSGVPCVISAYAANGVLVHFVNGKGQNGWTSAIANSSTQDDKEKDLAVDRASVAARVERLCPPSVKPCRVIATYDAATPRMQVIEDVN